MDYLVGYMNNNDTLRMLVYSNDSRKLLSVRYDTNRLLVDKLKMYNLSKYK